MICAWQELLNILPVWLRPEINKLGRNSLQELRLRLNHRPELILSNGAILLDGIIQNSDLSFCINAASKYSPWAADTIRDGYITAPGGHRIGICGKCVIKDNRSACIDNVTSLCIRVARAFIGLSGSLADADRSILLLGPPGSGKTTLLRDMIRYRSDKGPGSVSVVDEKGELFPSVANKFEFDSGKRTDILSGCHKSFGIESVLRNMSPSTIAVDEITASADCDAIMHAGWCGVGILATAHADDLGDLYRRPVYQKIMHSKLFSTVVVLRSDKSWYVERIKS